MELVIISDEDEREIARCDIDDALAQRLTEQAEEEGIDLEEYALNAIIKALELDERHRALDEAWERSTKAFTPTQEENIRGDLGDY